MDLTKWLPLWEKCPELRPESLSVCVSSRDIERLGLSIPVAPLVGTCFFVNGNFVRAEGHGLVAALIRDKAVWWLAAKEEDLVQHYPSGFEILKDVACDVCHMKTEPTEVLYLACCREMNRTP